METSYKKHAASALAAAVLAGWAGIATAEEAARIIVIGQGQIEAAPDMATITLGVTSEAETAKAAMDETSSGVAALLERLVAAEIEARDMQTSGLSLNPVWDSQSFESGPPRIRGFSASNTVTVRVRAIDDLGGILDGVLEAGANSFGGLAFGLQDPEPALDEARREAVADARRKAELYATAAGLVLGDIVSISEVTAMPGPTPMYRMEAGMAADAVPVAAGEMAVTAEVKIVWEIGG